MCIARVGNNNQYQQPLQVAACAKPEVLNKQRIVALTLVALAAITLFVGLILGPVGLPLILAGFVGMGIGVMIAGAADLQEAAGNPFLSSASRCSRVASGLLYLAGGALLPLSPIAGSLIFTGALTKLVTWLCEN